MLRNKKLEWNVLNYDWKKSKVVSYNIFGQTFNDILYKKVQQNEVTNIEELKTYIKAWGKRHFNLKAGYIMSVGDIASKYPVGYEKVDVYYQILMNLDIITDYVNRELEIFE